MVDAADGSLDAHDVVVHEGAARAADAQHEVARRDRYAVKHNKFGVPLRWAATPAPKVDA